MHATTGRRLKTGPRAGGAIVGTALLVLGPAARAAAPRASCTDGEGRAVVELACELADGLGPPTRRVRVRAEKSVWDLAAPRESALEETLASELRRALEPLAAAPAPGAAAGDGAAPLDVDVTVFVRGGVVHAEAHARGAKSGFWDRVRGLRGPPEKTARATRHVDGEIAAVLGGPVPLTTQVVKMAHGIPDVVAVACGDLDGDAALDVALVGRRRIALGLLAGARFEPAREVAWSTLVPVAPEPLREPIARAEIAGHVLRVGSTDRDRPLVLSPRLERLERLDGAIPLGAAGCLARGGTALETLVSCSPARPVPPAPVPVGSVDAAGRGVAVSPDGAVHVVTALRASADGSVTLRDAEGHTARIPSAGAALAVADVGLDGVVDVVASEDTLAKEADALVVRTWTPGSEPVESRRLAVPEGIRAVAVCPPDAERRTAVVVATPSSLWVLR